MSSDMDVDPLAEYPPMMLPTEAAAVLRTTESMLAQWRYEDSGPPYVKVTPGRNGRVLYPREDLRAYLAARTRAKSAGATT